MDIFTKCYNFKEADEIKAAGYYFFFRELESAQDTEHGIFLPVLDQMQARCHSQAPRDQTQLE